MNTPTVTLPRPVPVQAIRPPKANIPQTLGERQHIRELVADYVHRVQPVPPLPPAELRSHAEALSLEHGLDSAHVDYVGVLINNELWKEQLASVPFERRLLLMPKCLRIEERCPAPFDEFGLLCKQCGLCSIQDLQSEAERLGYAVLVAEGSQVVMSIIETGKVEAIVGVSCLSVLERAFPFMEAAAIPGVAIPLLQDDCVNTTVDLDWVWEAIHLTSTDRTRRLDLRALRDEVDGWFRPEALAAIMGPAEGRAAALGRSWLGKAGKRWRPFLTVCAWRACQESTEISDAVRKLAVAVECFHKASLIHDDIEDGDAERYGEPTLHAEVGMGVALNVGDLLIGEGYRLIAEAAPSERASAMILAAARGHRDLCLGQGAELDWFSDPQALSVLDVLGIFKGKTAPAFDVALTLGALHAGADDEELSAIARYSEALGIAYQCRDDLDDFARDDGDLAAQRPSVLMASALDRIKEGEDRALVEAWWKRAKPAAPAELIREVLADHKIPDHVRQLMESFKERAVTSLRDLGNDSLKGLLRRLMGKIFDEHAIKGWCKEEMVKKGIVETGIVETATPARSAG